MISHLSAGLVTLSVLAAQAPQPSSQDAFFGLERIWDVHVEITGEAWDALYPKDGRRSMGLSMRGRFAYQKATVTIAGVRCADVGLRFKGNSTFWMTNGSLKRSLKIDFDRYAPKQRFLGLRKLNLQNNATDPTQIREAVSYAAYRAAGIPSSRTCFARVFLSIADRTQKEYLGLYTVVEQVDRDFLQRHFGKGQTFLMKPEGRVLPFHGDTWGERYDEDYVPKTKPTKATSSPVVRLAKLLDAEAQKDFGAQAAQSLDVDEFLRYVAVTTVLCNLDSPMWIPHNFYLAVPEKTGRVVWVPWDLNLSLGGFTLMGDTTHLSVMEPARFALLSRLLAIPEYEKSYRGHVARLIDEACSVERLLADVKRSRATVATALAQEKKRSRLVTDAARDPGTRSGMADFFRRGSGGMFRPRATLDEFVKDRIFSVRDQLAGEREGRTIGGFFGRGGGGRARSRKKTAHPLLQDLLAAGTADGEKLPLARPAVRAKIAVAFVKLDTDGSASLSRAELAAAFARQIKARGGRPGTVLPRSRARRTLKTLDGDDTGDVTLIEWTAAYDKALPAWDTDKDGVWAPKELRPAR